MRQARGGLVIAVGLVLAAGASAVSTTVRISQVYGGGGNTDATYRNDYIELRNCAETNIDLTGWSVQYAASNSTTWTKSCLDGIIPAGGYYLVQEKSGGIIGAVLPTPNATDTVNLATDAGKVALVASTNLLTSANPATQSTVVDFVGYGGANGYEGLVPAPGPSNNSKQGILRKKGGLSDTDDNSADFVVGTPDPHNRDSPPLLRAGDIAIIGWDDASNLFSFVALTEISSGSTIHFTDNGWSNTQYRISEKVVRFEANASIPAGTIIQSDAISNIFTWVCSGGYANLDLNNEGGEQIYAFQGPLVDPATNLFVLDDSGFFEPATNSNTGGVAPGLVLNRTAITFTLKKTAPHFMAFTNFPNQAKTKVQWLMAIADSNNWQFGSSGTLPSGPLMVNPPPALTLLASPETGGILSGAGLWDEGSSVAITAVPTAGYEFLRWSDANRNATRTILMPGYDVTNTAYFASKATVLIIK